MSTSPKNTKFHRRATSTFAIASLLTLGFLPFASRAVADSAPAAGTVITNFSTATFEDPLTQTTTAVTSNIATITIAEIAGVTVVGTGVDANASIDPNDIIYFNFTINNIGNDPTQFFIPGLPSSVSALGTFAATAPIEIVETKDGNGVVVPLPGGVSKINVPAIGATSPSVPAGGTVRIRVPIKVAATVVTGDVITVVMGDTLAANRGNQTYVNGSASKDLYTIDNGTPLPTGEIANAPANGVMEASASQAVTINPAVIPLDFGELPNTYKTTLVDNGARHAIVPAVYLGTSITAETNGSPVIAPGAIVAADSDGVIFDPVYGQQILRARTAGNTTNTIKVTASTAGYLNAWIDLNGNGTFDAADRVLTEIPVVAGENNINVTLPSSAINGKTYARFRFTTGINQATLATGLATNGEVEDYQIQIIKSSLTPTTTSLCKERGGISNTDNLIFGGNFPIVGAVGANVPGATTDYIYDSDPNWGSGWPNDGSTTPNDGHYLVTPSTGSTTYNNGAWHDLSEHTGDGGGMMVVNGSSTPKVFETAISNLTVGKTYEFSTWAANLATATGGSTLPDLKLEYSEDGGTIWKLLTNSGAIAQTATPTWNIYGNFFTAKTTSIKLRVSNNQTGATGNDFAIDDLRLEGCDVPLVSGRVFEDVNYGGGAGRNYIAAKNSSSTVPVEVPNAVVELYEKQSDNSFKKVAHRNTVGDGSYEFTTADGVSYNGIYRLRVVNTSVKSNRPGSVATLIPVQTFREDPSAATPDIVNEVGGVNPKLVDAPAQTNGVDFTALTTATTVPQSSTTATMADAEVKNLDFGYNFDTIVNTNDAGQGSLRQFITNSNTLINGGLAQQGLTAGKETSIFMISSGSAAPGLLATIPNQLTGGVAVINIATEFPQITDANTSVDGTTQTTNIGDNNSGQFGTGGTVGVDQIPLDKVNKPEVELSDGGLGLGKAFEILADDITVRGMSIWGFGKDTSIGPDHIIVGNYTGVNPARTLIEQNIIGTKATDFSVTGSPGRGSNTGDLNTGNGIGLLASTGAKIQNNLIGFNGGSGIIAYGNGSASTSLNTNLTISGNEIRGNGTWENRDGIALENGTNNSQAINNLIIDTAANGVSIYNNGANSQLLVENNTVQGSGRINTKELAGVYANDTAVVNTKNIISKNIITLNAGAGVFGMPNINGMKVTQNSIFSNGGLGIDLRGGDVGGTQLMFANTVTPNDGVKGGSGFANLGIDYPIITSSVLSAGTLTVKGYIGSVAAGSATFNAVNLEFFIAADDGNNNGSVISGDGKSKPHGEGKTYIGSCVAGATGLFNCALPNAGTVGVTDAKNITATATDSTGNTSEFSAVPIGKAKLLIVKRITAIKDGVTGAITNFSTFEDDTTSTTKTNDNNCNWKDVTNTAGVCTNTYTVGKIDAGKVKPGDEVEYTTYYLNAGDNKANPVRICTRLDASITFQTQFDSTNAATVGKGIGLAKGGGLIQYLTNVGADADNGQLTTPALASNCNLAANTGNNLSSDVVVVDVGDANNPLMGSTGAGTPTTSYGYIRFKAKVK